jgi:hypothetical protein
MGSKAKAPKLEGLFFAPMLMPPDWLGARGNECCRRLLRSDRRPDLDPWVALSVTAPETHRAEVLPPGGLRVVGEVVGQPVDFPYALTLACAMLDQQLRKDDLQVTPMDGKNRDLSRLIYEDYAASILLLPHVLQAIQKGYGTKQLFAAAPTRGAIYFAGTPPGAGALAELVSAAQQQVPAESQLTQAILLIRDGEIIDLAP